tara:strand:- start:1095 stop:1286 length:192 start_codon:yes stop_codon:yes gene_type:complete
MASNTWGFEYKEELKAAREMYINEFMQKFGYVPPLPDQNINRIEWAFMGGVWLLGSFGLVGRL